MVESTPFVYGLDPSLRHGCLVAFYPKPFPQWSKLYEWSKKSESLSENSGLLEIGNLCHKISDSIVRHYHLMDSSTNPQRAPVLVEFDPTSVYWRSGKLQIVKLALFLGYLAGQLHSAGFPVLFITPKEIRMKFGLLRGTKELFHEVFLHKVAGWFPDEAISLLRSEMGTDYFDAVAIATTYYYNLKEPPNGNQ